MLLAGAVCLICYISWSAGCSDGSCVIWDFETRGIAKEFRDKDSVAAITSVCWSKNGHRILVAAADKSLTLWMWSQIWHGTLFILLFSVSLTGLVYIWAKDYTENWSAFAPDFKELEENEEYVEREDEFDLVPEAEKVKDSDINEDEEIDIVAVEKDSAFSDSDMSQDEIRFLPADPSPDIPELQDVHVLSTSKLGHGSQSLSPLSEEAGQNGHLTNHESSPLEEDTGGTRLKRRRKSSEKVLDFEEENVRKPQSKMKESINLLKTVDEKDYYFLKTLAIQQFDASLNNTCEIWVHSVVKSCWSCNKTFCHGVLGSDPYSGLA
ncbi:UNVERIFIED_CONTAM: protein RBL [Sesamum radiatum]|uniref:Protein RBL n=1 Tax=Sesamum radiatum TaxID=300843 RepID=A0AAW2S584_SESRA